MVLRDNKFCYGLRRSDDKERPGLSGDGRQCFCPQNLIGIVALTVFHRSAIGGRKEASLIALEVIEEIAGLISIIKDKEHHPVQPPGY